MKLQNPLITKKLRLFYFENNWTHDEVKDYLANHYCIFVCKRTLQYWKKSLKNSDWEHPIRPKPPIPRKVVSSKELTRILDFRRNTGWGPYTIKRAFNYTYSESTIKRIIKSNGLSRGSKIENKRIHWVKWQRKHPDSLWQLDGSKLPNGNWILPILDDCSRYNVALKEFKTITTEKVISFLEDTFKVFGKPREILTDNGTEFGGLCRTSKFDTWCEKVGVKHIRSKPHKPTTAGKVERFHGTFQQNIEYCKGDIELFRYRYNQMRPHRSLSMKTPAEIYFSIPIRIKGRKTNDNKW